MRLNFQQRISGSQTTLPVSGVIAIILWIILPIHPIPYSFVDADYGLWRLLPSSLLKGSVSLALSASCGVLAVYMMAELNNANMLLRVNSRMLASMLAVLLGMVGIGHQFQPTHIIMLFMLLGYFPLFATYQQPNPFLSFLVHLLLSMASLVFPKLLWFMPFYWLIQGYLRALSLRCFVASWLAVLLPYWVYGGVAVLTDNIADYWTHLQQIVDFHWGDYIQLPWCDMMLFGFMVILFVTGAIDFAIFQYKDKTRTRIIYNVLILHGLSIIAFICLQPHYFWTLHTLLLLDTSILFGHFFTLTHTRLSHIYCLVLLVLTLLILAVQILPPHLLSLNSQP
ncbi:MAG: hypothetical protein IKN44_07045 [Bacteroidaceae bacterium]|nr:hypothetical protein [Bacteroidaceae bacterium]MBR3619488.1 hypothetical protein [Bacteroidaceae bacterium]